MTEEKLRILAAGDLHGDIGLAKTLAERAHKENVDVVVLCGDLTKFDESVENMIGPFKKLHEKVLLIPGNHEPVATVDFLAELYEIKNLHGYSVRYKDVGIFGAGGCTQVGPHSVFTDKQMIELLQKGFDKISYLPKKIMVTHEHPADSKMEKFTSFFPGSPSIRKAIDMFHPDLMLCSHVHEAEGIEEMIGSTRVINVGRHGKIIEI